MTCKHHLYAGVMTETVYTGLLQVEKVLSWLSFSYRQRDACAYSQPLLRAYTGRAKDQDWSLRSLAGGVMWMLKMVNHLLHSRLQMNSCYCHLIMSTRPSWETFFTMCYCFSTGKFVGWTTGESAEAHTVGRCRGRRLYSLHVVILFYTDTDKVVSLKRGMADGKAHLTLVSCTHAQIQNFTL